MTLMMLSRASENSATESVSHEAGSSARGSTKAQPRLSIA